MIGFNVVIDGDEVLIQGLDSLEELLPSVIQDGLGDIIDRVHAAAIRRLQGPKRGVRTVRAKKSGRQRTVALKPELAGSDPIPRVTGNLLRLLGSVKPGRSKTSRGLIFTAGPLEAILYDSARYSSQISGGTGSSAKYGARPFEKDAVEEVEPQMPAIINERINRLLNGLRL